MSTSTKLGKYVVVEGLHRTGKSTQCALLVEHLRSRGINTFETAEPVHGGVARRYVQERQQRDPLVEAMLMYADRRELIRNEIEPRIQEGEWVVASRNFLSTLYLQGGYGGIAHDRLAQLHRFAMDGLMVPDLIVLLDPKGSDTLMERSTDELLEADSLEKEIASSGLDAHIWQYLRAMGQAIELHPKLKLAPVAAEGAPEEVHERIWEHIEELGFDR